MINYLVNEIIFLFWGLKVPQIPHKYILDGLPLNNYNKLKFKSPTRQEFVGLLPNFVGLLKFFCGNFIYLLFPQIKAKVPQILNFPHNFSLCGTF